MKILTKEQILDYHKELINRYGDSHGIRDENCLSHVFFLILLYSTEQVKAFPLILALLNMTALAK